MWFKPFIPQGEAGSVRSLPLVGHHIREFMARVCLGFFPISMWGIFFLICLLCRSHSSSYWVSCIGNCSVCSCRFGVSVEGGKFRILPSPSCTLTLSLIFLTAILTVMRCYLTVVLICMSLMTSDVTYIFVYLLATCVTPIRA